VAPETAFDPNDIAELFWTAHSDGPDEWLVEYRFEPTQGQAQGSAGAVDDQHRAARVRRYGLGDASQQHAGKPGATV
jgi:hypothetical protein